MNRPCSSVTNTKCKHDVMCHAMFLKRGGYRCTMLQVIVTHSGSPSKFHSSRIIFHYINVRLHNIPKLKVDQVNVNRDDNTCKLILNKCHWESYQNDIKHHNDHMKYNT